MREAVALRCVVDEAVDGPYGLASVCAVRCKVQMACPLPYQASWLSGSVRIVCLDCDVLTASGEHAAGFEGADCFGTRGFVDDRHGLDRLDVFLSRDNVA